MITTPRHSRTRTLLAIGMLLVLGTAAARAQDQTEAPDAGVTPAQAVNSGVIETVAAIVHGLSGNDLLNVRATASPIGLVLARIPNGTLLTRLECSTTRNTEWCRVEVPDLDGLVGWTPARYLHFADAGGEPSGEPPARLPEPQVIDPSQITVGILPDPLPTPDDPLADTVASPVAGVSDLQTALLAPAADAPSNEPALFDAASEARKIDGAATDLALAYATRSDAAVSEVYSALGSDAERDGSDPAIPADAATSSDVPLPSPRPARETELGSQPAPATTAVAIQPSDTVSAADPTSPAAPVEQAAPASAEPETPGPSTETAPAANVVRRQAETASDQPSVPGPQAPASPDIPVALASPDSVETSESSLAVATSGAGTSLDDADGSGQTLREQLAALLPSWSRPGPQTPTVSDDAGPSAPPAGAPEDTAIAEDVAVTETPSPPDPVDPPTPDSVVVAEVPCARYAGQPMTRCEARIIRIDENDADVTVLWPDGGERLIRFRGGQPDSANGRGDFRFTREAELNLIRVGSGERFEILDALPFAE